jgi:tetratricopeptide (TPR) repeat protein
MLASQDHCSLINYAKVVVLLSTLGVLWGVAARAAGQGETDPIFLLNHGRVEEARKLLLEALRTDPANPHAHALLGEIAFEGKDYAAAAAHFAKGEQIVAHSPRVSVHYAEALLQTKNIDGAERVLAALPPADGEAQFRAGLLLAGSERYLQAEKHFLAARANYRAADILAYNLALAQYNARKFKECAVTLEEARQKGLRDGDILNLSGLCYLDGGQPQKALATFQEGIAQTPADERNYVGISRLAIEEDQPMTGLEFVNKGLQLLPKSYTLLLQRGYLNLSQGQYPESEADYRKALELKPDSASAQIGLAFVLLENQQLQ